LYEALDEIIDGENYSGALKCEAKETKKKIKEIKGWFRRPEAILNSFTGSSWTSSYHNK